MVAQGEAVTIPEEVLCKEFVISSKCMRHNIINLMIAWNVFDDCGERMNAADIFGGCEEKWRVRNSYCR